MDRLIDAFRANLNEALQIAHAAEFKQSYSNIKNVIICGMGGSGIGGKLVHNWIESELTLPVTLIQDYDIPNFANQNTLFITSSYSGNTEETLECMQQAIDKKCQIIAVTSGGKLKEICENHGFDCVIVPGGNPPRTQLAFSVVQLTNFFQSIGLIKSNYLQKIQKAKELLELELPNIHIEAKALAEFLRDKIVAVYSSPQYEAVAIRGRQQFNENAKVLCWHHVVPEMNHNELVGWAGADDKYAALFIDTLDWNPRNKKRMEINIGVIEKMTPHVKVMVPKGENKVEKSLYAIHVIDWASYYLSVMYQTDPVEIKVIDYLKGEMGKF